MLEMRTALHVEVLSKLLIPNKTKMKLLEKFFRETNQYQVY